MGMTLPVSIPSTTTRAPEGKEVTFNEPLPVWACTDAVHQQAAIIIVNTQIISLCITVPPKCSSLLLAIRDETSQAGVKFFQRSALKLLFVSQRGGRICRRCAPCW